VLLRLQDALLSKLDAAATLLRATSVCDAQQMGQQLSVMQQLLQVLAACGSTSS
jgi:hypothetical protein